MALILGLDLGGRYARGALVRTSFRSVQVVRYLSEPIPKSSAPDAQAQHIREAIQAMMAALRPGPNQVIAAIEGEAVAMRTVELPVKAAKKAAMLLPFELEGEIPFEPDEVILDHQEIGRSATEATFLVAAVEKEVVSQRVELLRSAGVQPRELAAGAALFDGLSPLAAAVRKVEPTLLVDVGAERTDFVVLLGGEVRFCRTLSQGQEALDLGGAGSQERFSQELRRTLVAWNLSGGEVLTRGLLSGELARRDGASEWLAGVLEIPIEVLPLPEAPGADASERPAFARALALAGRSALRGKRINLLQGEFATRESFSFLRKNLPLIAACAAVVLLAGIFAAYARYSVLSDRNAVLTEELARVTRQQLGRESRSVAGARELLRSGVQHDDPMPRFDAYDALTTIATIVPEGITHDVRRLHIDLGDERHGGRFELQGTVTTIQEAEQVMGLLREQECFQELEMGNVSRTANERRTYRLEGEIQCPVTGAAPGARGRNAGRSSGRGNSRSNSRSNSRGSEGGS